MKYTRNALLVFVLLAFMYGYYFQNPQANGNSRIGLIFAIVQQRSLTIDSYQDAEGTRTIDKSFYNGHYYSDKAIGTSVLGALFYAPLYLLEKLSGVQLDLADIKYILTVLVVSLPSAFAGSLVYVLCETISGSRLRAYLATLAVALGTMILPFSAIFFGHQLAGALLFCSFFLIFQIRLKPGLRNNPGYLFLIGFLLGAAFITEYTVAVIILPLACYYLYVLWEKVSFRWIRSAILPCAFGALIPLAILLAYNTLAFGNPFSIGYQYLDNQFQASMSQGFMGIGLPRLKVLFYLTVHPAQGLFWQSPVLLISFLGLYFMWRDKRYRFETIVILASFVFLLLVNAGYATWWGGYSFAPRHLIPALMFLSIPLVMIPRRVMPVLIILCVISISQMLIPLAGTTLVPDDYFTKGNLKSFFGYSTIYSSSLQALLKGYFAVNLGEKILGLKKWMILLPNILAILIASGLFIVYDRHQPPLTYPGQLNPS